jgi:hypothetical protein
MQYVMISSSIGISRVKRMVIESKQSCKGGADLECSIIANLHQGFVKMT